MQVFEHLFNKKINNQNDYFNIEESDLKLLPFLSSDFQATPIVTIKFEEGYSSRLYLTFEKLTKDTKLRESFEASFKISLAKDLDVNPDKIRILKISKGSIAVEFQVIEAVNTFNFDANNKD